MPSPVNIDSRGYGRIYKAVMRNRQLPLLAKTLYAYFCAYAGSGYQAYPKRDKTVRDLRINKDTYTKHLNRLVAGGYIVKERTTAGNLYTIMARSMVAQYGMSEKFGMMGLETIESQYLDGRHVTNCSATSEAELDQEIRKIIDESYVAASKLLENNKEQLKKISEYLFEKETITGEQFMQILNASN